jgi:Uma2 family endonuclease
MATRTTLTLDQFLALPERDDGTHYELSQGELITLPPPGYRHGALVMGIGALLLNSLDRKKYAVTGADSGFLLDPNPEAATVRGADIAVSRRTDVGENLPTGWFSGAPLLAVEVVSPSNTAKDMQLKVKQYLEAGALEVWLVYPDTRTLYVYSAGRRDPQVFEERDTFNSVVGKTFRVEDLFDV